MNEQQGNSGNRRWSGFTARLKASTSLSNPDRPPDIEPTTMRRIRDALFPVAALSRLGRIKNPYRFAKERMNGLWSGDGQRMEADSVTPGTPVSNLTSVRGVMASYWTGENLKQSLKPTLGLMGMITVSGVSAAQVINSSAEIIASVFNDGNIPLALAKFTGYGLTSIYSNKAVMKLSHDLKQSFAFSLRDQFKQTIKDKPGILKHIESEHAEKADDDLETSSPHHAIGQSIGELSESLVNAGTRGFASVTTAAALTYAIAQKGTTIGFLGDINTVWASIGMVGVYAGLTYKYGSVLGKVEEEAIEVQQKAEAKLTQDLVKAFDPDNKNCAASFSEKLDEHNDRILDKTVEKNKAIQQYAHFWEKINFGGIAISGTPAALATNIGEGALSATAQQAFMATWGQTQFLLHTVNNAVDLFASRGRVTVPAKIISEIAQEFETAYEAVSGEDDSDEETLATPPKPIHPQTSL